MARKPVLIANPARIKGVGAAPEPPDESADPDIPLDALRVGSYEVVSLKVWAKELGLDWDEVLERAGIGRTTAWRLQHGIAGRPTVEIVKGVLRAEESELGKPTSIGLRIEKIEALETLAHWWLTNRPQQFDVLLGALYDIWASANAGVPPTTIQGNILETLMQGPVPVPDISKFRGGVSPVPAGPLTDKAEEIATRHRERTGEASLVEGFQGGLKEKLVTEFLEVAQPKMPDKTTPATKPKRSQKKKTSK